MNMEERKKELLAELKTIEKQEQAEAKKRNKAERRKFNDMCKRHFGMGITQIEELIRSAQ